MTAHVTKVCQLAYTEIRRISSIRRYLSVDATKVLVTSCVLSRLDYCNGLLMGADKKVIAPLQKVQNSAARLIFKAPWRQPTSPLLRELHWLPVAERIDYKVACVCFHSLSGTAPTYIQEILPKYKPKLSSLRSASDTRLLQPQSFHRKRHGHRSLSAYGPSLWNNLPYDLRHCETLTSFKAKLKTHLFNKVFN